MCLCCPYKLRVDPGESYPIKWTDIDKNERLIRINNPVKRQNPRILPISQKWIVTLERRPIRSERVFGKVLSGSMYANFNRNAEGLERDSATQES